LAKFSAEIINLKLEHLFVDPFLNNDLILPTGEYRDSFLSHDLDEFRRQVPWLLKNFWPHAKMLGFNFKGLENNFDKGRLFLSRARQGKKNKIVLSLYLALAYYNILSITYMLCKKSFSATNVRNKNARKR
jgi:hypothetical protein